MKVQENGNSALMEEGDSIELSPPLGRRRRCRTQFSLASLRRLEEEFAVDPYPDVHQRETLAEELNVTEDRIQVWFQNRRSKQRRLRSRKSETDIKSIAAFLRSRIRTNSNNSTLDNDQVGVPTPVIFPSPYHEALRLYPTETQPSSPQPSPPLHNDNQTAKENPAPKENGVAVSNHENAQMTFKPRRPWEDDVEEKLPSQRHQFETTGHYMPYIMDAYKTFSYPVSTFGSLSYPEQLWYQREGFSSYPFSMESVYVRAMQDARMDVMAFPLSYAGIR